MKIHAFRGVRSLGCLLVLALPLVVIAMGGDGGSPAADRLATLTAGTLDGRAVQLPIEWPRGHGPLLQPARLELRFTVSDPTEPLGVFVTDTSLVFRASINQAFVADTGGRDARIINPLSYRSTAFFRVPPGLLRTGENLLTFELEMPEGSSYADFYPVIVGDANDVERLVQRRWLAFHGGPVLVGTVLFVVGLVALGLWRGRRDGQLFLLLSVGTMLWGALTFLQQWPTPLLPRPHRGVLIFSLYIWYPLLIAVFFLRFAYRYSMLLERIAMVVAAVAAPALYAASQLGVLTEATIALRAVVLIYVLVALIAVARYALQLRTLTGYTLFAMAAVCVGTGMRDFYMDLVSSGERVLVLGPYSGAALVLFVGWLLLERYHKAYAEFEMLSRDLELRVAAANVELHRRIEQVEAARATAEQANVAKSRFFAAASHDLRQPLHSLGLFASALRDVVGNPEGRDLVRRIGDSIGALNRLFDELLDISRLEAGTVEVRRRDIALQPLFDRLTDELGADALEKGLRLRFHPTTLAVNTDPTLLERVLANLVSNAIRYTRDGGVLIGARRRGQSVELQVWDSGIGIPLEQHPKIFEEFYQVANPARDPRQGLGLGLAIVRRLTALLGMPLDFRSVMGRGTCFMVRLPRAAGPITSEPPEEPPESDRHFDGRRALVIDDDVAICEATVHLLDRWGFESRAAAHFAQACEQIDAGFAPDVILADLRLAEDNDGIRTVEQAAGTPAARRAGVADLGRHRRARTRARQGKRTDAADQAGRASAPAQRIARAADRPPSPRALSPPRARFRGSFWPTPQRAPRFFRQ